jgi:putative endopeptidase
LKDVGLRGDMTAALREAALMNATASHIRSRHDGQLLAVALPIVMAAALAWWYVSPSAAQSSRQTPSRVESTVDASVVPGDDFYGYANGAWLKATTLPDGKARWGARDELEEQARRRVAELLDAAGVAPAGSAAHKVADVRAGFLNTAAIEAKGLAPLKPLLDDIANVSNKADLARLLGRGMRADVDPMGFGIYNSASVLGLAVEQSIHGEKTNSAFLLQGGLGLDRDDYLSADTATKRERYRQHIAKMLALAGFDRADERASAVLALETAIAQSHATAEASGQDHNADNVWTRSDLTLRAPGMDWTAFFDAAELDSQGEFVVWQPSAVIGLGALVASEPLESWKDYLRFHTLHDFADVLPRAFSEEALAIASTPQPSRAERALAATQSGMGDALGRMYAKRYFPAQQKARLERISDNVRAALIKRIESATSMSPQTKAIALVKLKTLYVGLGYPDQWETCSSLIVDPNDPFGNQLRVFDRARRNALARLRQSVDLKQWYIAPQNVGAILVFQQNSYVMAAALLEPPKYDHASSDAAAYGSIGALIGHDMTHYIDTLGADYDTDHRMRRWWTADDLQRYQQLAQPLVDQYSAYQPLPGVAVNGKLSLTENVADLRGLIAAFDAYRNTVGDRAKDPKYVRDQDREFFIAYAQTQRRKISEAALRKQATSSDHAPEEYRAGTVRNLDAWYDAFHVRPGQRLYLEPAARVRVW